jgi:hypothetical protein
MLLKTQFLKIVIEFIWENFITILINNISVYIVNHIKDLVKNYLLNSYLNKYFVKRKLGVYLCKGEFDGQDNTKCIYSEDYKKIINYIVDAGYKVKKIINKNNPTITNYNLLADCELKLNNNINVCVKNNYNKISNTIISTIELYSYSKLTNYLESFVDKLN